MKIVVGTGNPKKLVELAAVLPQGRFELSSLADHPTAIDPLEDGLTFEANAQIKATQQAIAIGHWVIADDSGLAVDALAGQPGVHSARYAGVHGDDAGNNAKLLSELKDVPTKKRGAKFICCLCVSDPKGNVVATARGECRGRILTEPQGEEGFGYDPLFLVEEYHQSFAQLGASVKRAISHRAVAMRAIRPQLLAICD